MSKKTNQENFWITIFERVEGAINYTFKNGSSFLSKYNTKSRYNKITCLTRLLPPPVMLDPFGVFI